MESEGTVSLDVETDEDCLPCKALEKLCQLMPTDEAKSTCNAVKKGLEDETISADEGRRMLAEKVGRAVLRDKLSEVSDWLEEEIIKSELIKEKAKEVVPLKEDIPEIQKEELPPIPEEYSKPIEEVLPIDGDEKIIGDGESQKASIEESNKASVLEEAHYDDDFSSYPPIEDYDEYFLYDDYDVW